MLEIVVSSIKSKILNCSDDIAKKLWKYLSYQSYNYEYSTAYLFGGWDGKVHKFAQKGRTFPTGLLYRVGKWLKRNKVAFKVTDYRQALIFDEKTVVRNIDNLKHALRPYQIDGLIKGLYNPYIMYWWATSSGKTVLFSSIIQALKKKDYMMTLILVATKDLAAQHREELQSMMGIDVGYIEEGKFDPKRISVAVINTLWAKAKRRRDSKVLNYLNSVQHLIIDEAHRSIDSKMFRNTIGLCKNTVIRHGFSASPYSLTTDDIELESVTGPPLSRVTMSQLIREGWVSRPYIFFIDYEESWKMSGTFARVYEEKIVKGARRNEIIIDLIKKEFENEKSILVLIRIIKHGRILSDMLINEGFLPDEFAFVHGQTNKHIRNQVKDAFRRRDLKLVIASQIWNEGIDIPSIDVLIKADAGGGLEIKQNKGIRSVVQQTGRVIRKPILPGEKDVRIDIEHTVTIYDFNDKVHKDLAHHSKNRFSTFAMEPEFVIRRIKL